MRALVTGGAGFVGAALVERLLAEGHAVDVVDDLSTGRLAHLAAARAGRHDLSFHQLDVRAPELVELVGRRRPDVVYHLTARRGGAASVAAPVEDAAAVVAGALRVLEAARLGGADKVVVAVAATDLYGATPGRLPAKESTPPHPVRPRGVAVGAVAGYLALYRELHQLEHTVLALGTVYGPGQPPGAGVVATLAAQLLDGVPCTLDGGGQQRRDLVYVDDVVDALARAAGRGGGLLLNVGTGVATSVASLHAAVAAAVGVDASATPGPPRPGEVARSCLDPARAAIHLGWRPWTALPDGIAATVAGLRARRG